MSKQIRKPILKSLKMNSSSILKTETDSNWFLLQNFSFLAIFKYFLVHLMSLFNMKASKAINMVTFSQSPSYKNI